MNKFEELFDSFRVLKRLVFRPCDVSAKEHASTKLQFVALGLMKEFAPVSVGELADHLKLSRSSMTQLVDRLVKMGLVEREHEIADRRMVRLKLNVEGEESLKNMRAKIIKEMQEIFGFLDKEDIDSLIRVHKKIINHFNQK